MPLSYNHLRPDELEGYYFAVSTSNIKKTPPAKTVACTAANSPFFTSSIPTRLVYSMAPASGASNITNTRKYRNAHIIIWATSFVHFANNPNVWAE